MIGLPGLDTRRAPSPALPLRFLATGAGAFVLLQAFLAVRGGSVFTGRYLDWATVGAVHLATLGWITMVMVGAAYQLIPVLLQVGLFSERLGRLSYWPLAAGAAGMVAGFWSRRIGLVVAGGFLAAFGLALFLYNAVQTLRGVRAWTPGGRALGAALAFLLLTAAWGVLLLVGLHHGALGGAFPRHLAAHAVLGVAGWVSLTIVGVGYRLLPMFALSHGHSLRRQGWTALALGLGAAGGAAGALGAGRGAAGLGAALVACALAAFCLDTAAILRRRRRRLEPVSLLSAAGVACGGAAAALAGLGVAGWLPPGVPAGRVVTAVAYLALGGWASLMIAGQLLKIVPFLVWLGRYGERAGREPVPLVRDLYDPRLGTWAFRLLLPGTLGGAGAVLAGSPAAGALFSGVNLAGALALAAAVGQAVLGRRSPPRGPG